MRASSGRTAAWISLVFALSTVALLALGSGAASATHPSNAPRMLFSLTLVSAPPAGTKGPDDLTHLTVPGLDHGAPVIWTAYQNGINPNGTPGSPGGPTQSTVAGYDPVSGRLVYTINVTGKLDGLTADPAMGALLATANEDNNSDFNVILPSTGTVTTYHYSPNPSSSGNGGTDSIAVEHGVIYVAHSNPNDTTQATDYSVTLNSATRTASLSPVFFDDSAARDALTGGRFALTLTDPDTNFVMPGAGERFAGELATISQGDGKIIFASHLAGSVRLSVLNLTDNVSGNLPPIDGIAVATASEGTLYVVDAKANTITALVTDGLPSGTIFVSEPNDNGNPLLGVLNPWTGHISPLGNSFASPKGLLFVPDHDLPAHDHPHPDGGEGDGDGHGDHRHFGEGGGRWDWFFGRW